MSLRSSFTSGVSTSDLMDPTAEDLDQQQAQEILSDDDNAQIEEDDLVENEDPLLLAIDDLEGRVVSALDDVRTPTALTSQDELATLLRPVLEVAAHTGPSVARTYCYRGTEGVDQSVEEVYQRIVSDLVLPVMLEMAQSDTIPAKRVASLEFFRAFWKECHKAGSWMDQTAGGGANNINAGPYGVGSGHATTISGANTLAVRAILKRRQAKRLAREGEILRYWVEASIACTMPGVFTNEEAEGAVASRGIIAASGSLRPSLIHIATRIKDADDRGATRLYNPVMKMVEGVLKKMFLSTPSESLLSACIKFLEIVCMCWSRKPQDLSSRKRAHNTTEDFSLDDIPAGHPIITREALDSISEYAFTTLRGLALLGGQVKIDVNILSDMMLTYSGDNASTASQVVSILKPAALAYLEVEESSSLSGGGDGASALEYELDRTSIDFDFVLSQKSYTLTINAMSALALNRPVYFKEAAVCLARRAVKPPEVIPNGPLTRPAVLALTAQLKGSCLTLLRNALSIATNTWEILHEALKLFDMEIQADKALSMARQATALKTAGRAARNRANMYYEWDASESADRLSKRQRETGDALAKIRAAKAARGLGQGIQLPTSMSDAVELILLNLKHLPSNRPSGFSKENAENPITLDFILDAVMTNGASLSHQEGRWYDRDGGTAWTLDLAGAAKDQRFSLSTKMLDTLHLVREGGDSIDGGENENNKRRKLFLEQCQTAAGDATGRIVATASCHRSKSLANLGNQVAARLAFTLGKVTPAPVSQPHLNMAQDSVKACADIIGDPQSQKDLDRLVDSFPLVAACLALDATPTGPDRRDPTEADLTISRTLLNEALLQDSASQDSSMYDRCLSVWVASVVRAGRLSNEKPTDNDRKRSAARSAAALQRDVAKLPRLTKDFLVLVSSACDIEDIMKKAAESARKTSDDSIAVAAAAHAAKVAAEKRATQALLVLRDAAFQRSHEETRRQAVSCAVALASGRLPSPASILDKALKLTMNVLYAKNDAIAELVVECATSELQFFSDKAVEAFSKIEKANEESGKDEQQKKNPLVPHSDEEKAFMDMMRKPAVLYMALCVRRPDIIETLFRLSSVPNGNVLSKTVRANMSKLSRATAAKYGAAEIAMRVASMSSTKETPLLLSFLENLAPGSDKNASEGEIIEACFKIQESKADDSGKKDPRYIIPVVSVMKRKDLVERLPEFVAAEDAIFLAALVRMGDRHQRQALLFRDEPDEENPSLHGMTLCEQLVYLHRLDFAGAGLPQKRYLDAIKLCLNENEVYNDRVVMSALDHMSGVFLANEVPLPLAFMRTVILTCTKHESLHSWICHVLLPRLVEGKIFDDARQWEGWMRCAHMLEKSGDPNVSSVNAIQQLPTDQFLQYQTKWSGK